MQYCILFGRSSRIPDKKNQTHKMSTRFESKSCIVTFFERWKIRIFFLIGFFFEWNLQCLWITGASIETRIIQVSAVFFCFNRFFDYSSPLRGVPWFFCAKYIQEAFRFLSAIIRLVAMTRKKSTNNKIINLLSNTCGSDLVCCRAPLFSS